MGIIFIKIVPLSFIMYFTSKSVLTIFFVGARVIASQFKYFTDIKLWGDISMLNTLVTTHRFRRAIGLLSLIICIATWGGDYLGVVYPCPYCRAERTVIGLLGILLMLPKMNGLVKYLSSVLGGFGFILAATQHFMGWKAISEGHFEMSSPWYIDPMILSGGAIMFISFQITLAYVNDCSKATSSLSTVE